MITAADVVRALAALPEPADPDLAEAWRMARNLHTDQPAPAVGPSEPSAGMRGLFQGRSV